MKPLMPTVEPAGIRAAASWADISRERRDWLRIRDMELFKVAAGEGLGVSVRRRR
ncbi:hypothetical protein GCM10017620_28410 [Brevundimonas intermedia]|uniref:Uncharacterized protein n=1 Tax=Brevundimonas intermedia TaxID=74315 RepID=A0ABQ5TAM5_9CAUL|nr:hypothetical protein GCM10017620_28410 [Brevundimonas intermedia]